MALPAYTDTWPDHQWRSCASHAAVRQWHGIDLAPQEIEALRRHPDMVDRIAAEAARFDWKRSGGRGSNPDPQGTTRI